MGLQPGEQPTQVGPAQALLNALWLAHEDMALYAWLVSELDSKPGDSGLYGPTYHLTGQLTGEAKRHALVSLYEDAQKRVADIAAACLRAKVAERQVEIAQENAQTYAEAMRTFALALGHSPADPSVRQAMRASLSLVAGGKPA